MLKKAGFVAATAAGLTMLGGTAFAADGGSADTAPSDDGKVTYSQAYHDFQAGGAAAGYGAASMVAGAYTGVALTPANVMDNVHDTDNPTSGSVNGMLPQ